MLTLDTEQGCIYALAFTGNGSLVVGGAGGASVWQGTDKSRELGSLNKPVWTVDVSPNGRFVVVGGARRYLELSDRTGVMPQVFTSCPAPVTGACFLNDKRIVVTLGDRIDTLAYSCTVFLVDLPKVELKRTNFGAVHGVRALAVDPPRNRLAWVTDQNQLTVQDITRPATRPISLKKPTRALAFSPDGRHLVATSDWEVILFHLDHWPDPPIVLGRHRGLATSVAFTPDGRFVVTGSSDETIRTWSLASESEQQQLHMGIGRITALAISPDGLVGCAASDSGKLAYWDLE